MSVTTGDVAAGATLEHAYLYWAGTQAEDAGADSAISLTVPGGSLSSVSADACYGSDGGSSSYDMHMCRADITSLLSGGSVTGTYTIDGYAGLINDGPTDNASASLLLVYSDASLANGSVNVYDGLLTMVNSTQNISLSGFTAPDSPTGSLTYYTMEGDLTGSGTEQVVVTGTGGGTLTLSDTLNPSTNIMNRTINTTSPTQTGVIGVDIDRYDISSALAAGDTSLDIDYSAGTDKWWLGVNVVQVSNVPIPPALWLFGSGLLGLVGIARRKKSA